MGEVKRQVLRGKHRGSQPVGRTARRKWLLKAEEIAGIVHRQGSLWDQACRSRWRV